jgi:hypothetical protein
MNWGYEERGIIMPLSLSLVNTAFAVYFTAFSVFTANNPTPLPDKPAGTGCAP